LPIIVVGLALIGAIAYGAAELYMTVAAAFGWPAGIGALLLAAALLAALTAELVRRYRRIHGATVKGQRILALAAAWGAIHIDAGQKHGSISVNGQQARFIFADIAGAQAIARDAGWALVLRLQHNARAEWAIPMKDRKDARRWAKIFSLAAAQKL
jgi:membrane protein implicated in regulation of membrane protease activity